MFLNKIFIKTHPQERAMDDILVKGSDVLAEKQSAGVEVIDALLKGGLETDIITTVYGPAGSGKSNICLFAAVAAAKRGKQIIYVDTEGGFSVERLKQITENELSVLNQIMILQPTTFEEQKTVFLKLNQIITEDVGLIVVDTISMLYRLELGKSEDVYVINRELGRQISCLTEITRKRKIPVLIANQVYANFEDREKVNMVGGDIIKYGSKCLIELQILRGFRGATLRKHRSLPEGNSTFFRIKNKEIEEVNE